MDPSAYRIFFIVTTGGSSLTTSSLSLSLDLVIVGAGVFGLSIAYRALKAGMTVAVIEEQCVGAGASGGLLGALMPHMPARWNPKKEFQFQSLLQLETHAREVESETGLATGYRRCGRILPLTSDDKLQHHTERAEESQIRWKPEETGFSYVVEQAGSRADWLDPASAPFGLVHETLAARISPRAYIAALASYVRMNGNLFEGLGFRGYDERTGKVRTEGIGPTLTCERLVLANGYQAYDTLQDFTGQAIGRGEKGQAILMDGRGLEDRPAIYCEGLYVVPHEDGTVAIGSTSDRDFQDASVDPRRTEELVSRATAFCPSLKGREILTAWAGIRPRCNKRDPMIGLLPEHSRTFAAVGGFKISFGIAHLVARALVSELAGQTPEVPLPETFRPDHHFGTNLLPADQRE